MSIAKGAVGRPTTIFVIFVLLCLLGGFALMNLPVDLYPEINPPYLVVSTTYSGAGPEEVERSVTRVLEGSLANVSNLEKVTSTSSKGSSTVIMQFTYKTDLADASNSVRDSIEMVKRYLPTGADAPLIFKFNPSMIPIMGLMVTGNRNPEELREIAENTILPRIEQTPGVATGSVSGGRKKIIRIEIPQNRLEAYGITVSSLQSVLASQNNQVSAGSITEDGLTYILTTMGEYTSLDQIKDTVISYKGGGNRVNGQVQQPRTIRLRDIADVFEGYKDQESMVYVNGVPAVQISVQKQSGKNSVQTADALRKRLVQINKEIPQDIKITEIYNTTDTIKNSINQVVSTALQGAVLTVSILFVFLRAIKPTMIIGISIPTSILITFMLMYFSGLTLNMMTIAGLTLGVCMLVDNSIVILENVYRYREKGTKLGPASILGTQEMLLAIASSTLTTICMFAPLVAFQGLLEMMGEMFAGLAFTVVISLLISLLVAIFLVPVLSSHYLPLVTRKQKPLKGPLVPVDKMFERFFLMLENKYRGAVRKVLKHKLITIGAIVLLMAGSVLMVPKIGFVFMPQQNEDSVSISATLPIGSPLIETEGVLKRLEAIAKQEVQGYERMVMNVGSSGGMMNFGGSSSNVGSLRISLPKFKDRIDSASDIKTKLRRHFNDFPGVSFNFTSSGIGRGGSSNPVDILIKTQDLAKGKVIGEQIVELIRKNVPQVTEPQVDLKDGLPQIELHIDRERLYALGLNTVTVGNEIKAGVDGLTATRYKSGNIDYDVVLILSEADRSKTPDLDKIFTVSPITGQRIPVSSFATYDKGTGPITINRENQSRVIHVTGGVVPGTKINEVEEQIRALVSAEIPAEDDVIIEFSGDYAELMKYMQRFVLIIVVGLMLVFGVMASLFESFRDPFIVLFTVPLSIVGVVAIYLITGDTFNVLTAVGMLVLIGIITNNGIVLVDYTNMLRKRGYSLNDACIEAAGNRLRPILMTTVSTVLGLLPMAFMPGEGSELVAPIGKTTLGGLSFGTLMTLFLMPTIYAIVNKNSDARDAKAQARRDRIAAGVTRKQAKAQGQSAKPSRSAKTMEPEVKGMVLDIGEAGV